MSRDIQSPAILGNSELCRSVLRHRVGIRCGRGLGHRGCHRSVRPDPGSGEHVLVTEWSSGAPVTVSWDGSLVTEVVTVDKKEKNPTPEATHGD